MATQMEAEIRQQPDLWRENAGKYEVACEPLSKRPRPPLVVMAARGSSDNAALYLRYMVEIQLGVPVSLAAPSVVTVSGGDIRYPEGTWVVGISQSGSAPDVCEFVADARAKGCLTIGLTNNPGSRLAVQTDVPVLLAAGDELAVPATKTYTSTVLACYQIARSCRPSLPDPVPHLPGADWLEEANASAKLQCQHVVHGRPTFALGRGYSFSTALETSLKLMECALIACKGYSSADFHHGPKSLADATATVIDFTREAEGALHLPVQMILPPALPPHVPPPLHPMWDSVFGQFLALRVAEARGVDPDAPQFLRKVTSTR